jgi:hypothetical protein
MILDVDASPLMSLWDLYNITVSYDDLQLYCAVGKSIERLSEKLLSTPRRNQQQYGDSVQQSNGVDFLDDFAYLHLKCIIIS